MKYPRISPTAFALLAACVYLCFNGFTILHHEIWRDEAQVWLTVRDNGFLEMLGLTRWAGAPPLWFALIFPFAHLGLPILSQQLLHLAISTATIWVIARFAPWSRVLTVLLAAGYYFGVEYVIVSRSYALGLLFLFTIAAIDSKRSQWPLRYGLLVGLMANVSGHFLVVAAGFGLALGFESLARENRADVRRWAGVALALAGGLTSLFLLRPPDDFRLQGYEPHAGAILATVQDAVFPGPVLSSPFFTALAAVTLGLLLLHISRSRRALTILVVAMAGLFFIAAMKHEGALRHRGLVLMTTLAALWLAERARADKPFSALLTSIRDKLRAREHGMALLMVGLLASVDFTAAMHSQDWGKPFSGGDEMAQYLLALEEMPALAVHDSGITVSVLAHLPGVMPYQIDRRAYGTHFRENSEYEAGIDISDDELVGRVRAEFGDALPWLVLTRVLHDPASLGYAAVFAADDDIFGAEDEAFYLYRPMTGQ